MAHAPHYAFAALAALALAACSTDGTTASCRTEDGEELPRYNVKEVDDAGLHPDAQVNAIRQELVDKDCLTKLGNPVIDSGLDAGGD